MRELLVIRHAVAHERDRSRWPNDDERPLTRRGKRRFRQATRGIATALPCPDELLCSPLIRTRQTAEILRKHAGYPRPHFLQQLTPDAKTPELLHALGNRAAKCIAIVGHEPALSKLVSDLMQGRSASAFAIKKGAVVWISMQGGKARLVAHLTPKLLRALG